MGHATLSMEDHLKLRLKGLSTKFKKLMMFHNLNNNMGEIVVFFKLKKCLEGTEFLPQTLIRLQRFLYYKIQVCCKNSIPFFNSLYFLLTKGLKGHVGILLLY